ncbi:uncharacterized protein LOC131954619 [Physella acuta]|uniref:uncharacterized protein LOC131954619 n=1 Tax=Physella acuta TaxID=109671 RepID=UPI0027DE8736|nr:uncharacterized protein LOC131954619 [Physella acuta]
MMSKASRWQTVTWTVLGLLCLVSRGQALAKCEYNAASCSCMTEKGEISLKSLSKSEPYESDFKAKNEQYYWEPCQDFTMGTVKAGAVQVQVPAMYYDIGAHVNAGSAVDQDGVPLFYMVAVDGQRTTFVRCICSDELSFQFEKEDPQTNYHFTLKAKNCCPGHSDSGGSSSLSVGSILVIVFFSLLVCYLLLGIIYQSSIRKASGREIIPNAGLWLAIPGLIKDGVLFSFTCGKKSSYSSI